MSWMNNWQRSPRQDRRVVVDGKFVELVPLPKDVTEQEQSALEAVTEQVSIPAQEQTEGAPQQVNELGSVNPSIYIDRAKQGVHRAKPTSALVAYGADRVPEQKEAEVSYPTGSLGEYTPEEENYSAFNLDGPEHKQADEEMKDAMATALLKKMVELELAKQSESEKLKDKAVFKLGEEGVVATISEYADYQTNAELVNLDEPVEQTERKTSRRFRAVAKGGLY
jgi:hypothetical protein